MHHGVLPRPAPRKRAEQTLHGPGDLPALPVKRRESPSAAPAAGGPCRCSKLRSRPAVAGDWAAEPGNPGQQGRDLDFEQIIGRHRGRRQGRAGSAGPDGPDDRGRLEVHAR
jgi:hypothetical protein